MHALAGEGIEVGGQGGNEGFALTGFHFRDAALVQDDAAHDLDGEVTHAQHAVGGLPAGGKGLRQDVIQVLPFAKSSLKRAVSPCRVLLSI